MSEFAGNVLGNNENLCVTASCGRNFVPAEREYSKESIRKLIIAIDVATVLAFLALVVVLSV